MLVRRNNTTGELAYYRYYAPRPVPLRELVRVAGRRWTVEESFQAPPGSISTRSAAGPSSQCSPYAFLTITAAAERTENPTPQGVSLIALTCNEIHRPVNTFIIEPIRDLRHRLHSTVGRSRAWRPSWHWLQ